jgi:hypothetical protein
MYIRPEAANTVHDKIHGILKNQGFTDEIVKALDAQASTLGNEEKPELARHKLLDEMVGRVAVDVNAHPRREIMVQLIKDSSLLGMDDFYGFLDFFHSCLVCHFKGELAELLAWPLLRKYEDRLVEEGSAPLGIQIIPGWKIKERRSNDNERWLKGSDALFIFPIQSKGKDNIQISGKNKDVTWGIIATAEIKSYRNDLRKVFMQSSNHVRRFRYGLRIEDSFFDSDKLRVLIPGKKHGRSWKMLDPQGMCNHVQRLAIRPVTLIDVPQDLTRGQETGSWIAELPIPSSFILEAAYRFAAWYVGLIGRQIYCMSGTTKDGCVENPHPEMSFEEAAENALIEALYFFGRDADMWQKQKKGTHPAGADRRFRTFNWLFNSLSYGHDQATGSETLNPANLSERQTKAKATTVILPKDELSPTVEYHLNCCNQAYKSGNQEFALKAVQDAKARDLPSDASLRVRWLEAMIAYRDTRFDDALRLFPKTTDTQRDFWGLRNQIMIARLNARCKLFDTAFQSLAVLLPLPKVYGDLPVEHTAVTALTCYLMGDSSSATREIDKALMQLKTLRQDAKEREEKSQGSIPNVNVSCIHMSIFDLVAVLVGLGRIDDALANLLPVSGFIGWEQNYIKKDPMLKPLFSESSTRQKIDKWLENA